MDTLIELYDERAIENVLGPDMFRPQRVIYLMPENVIGDAAYHHRYADFFRHRGWEP